MSLQTECNQLQTIPLFSKLDQATCKVVAMSSDREMFSAGDIVFNQGDPAEAVYFVLSGKVRVIRQDQETAIEVGTVSGGSTLGEAGVICGRSRSATVIAAEETVVLRISTQMFLELLECKPEVSMALSRELALRVDSLSAKLHAVSSQDK